MIYKTFFTVALSLLLFSSPANGKVELGESSTNWITYQVNVDGIPLNIAECVDYIQEYKIRIVADKTLPLMGFSLELDKAVAPNSIIKVNIYISENKRTRTIENVRFESNDIGDTLVMKNNEIALDVARCLYKKQDVAFTIKEKNHNSIVFFTADGVEYALSPILKNFR